MKRLKRVLKILIVNSVLLTIGIVIIELAFGEWLGTSKLNRLNLIKNYHNTCDVSHLYKSPNPIIVYSRDKYGLRGSHSNPGSIDILTVGGSTTDQRAISDGATWQDVLQNRFKQTGVTVIVANAGVDGQSTFGHIMNFKWWFPNIPNLAPDYILFYIGLNDFYIDAGNTYDHLLDENRSFNLRRHIQENSVLWHIARTLRGTYEAMVVRQIGHRSIDFKELQWTRRALQDDYSFMQRRLDAYADRLRILADKTYDFRAKPIFVSQQSRKYRITPHGIEGEGTVSSYEGHPINGVDYFHMMRRLNSVTKAVADEKGAIFIDLASHTSWTDDDFYDFEHMTPQGVKKIGTILYDVLRSIIPAAKQPEPNNLT